MLVLGTLGHVLKQLGVAPAPIVLGLILGNIAEMGYVQTILGGQAYQYPFLKLFESSLSRILIAMTVLSAAWPYLLALKQRIQARKASPKEDRHE
jgi:putative tricarboxylic transport membrane protein